MRKRPRRKVGKIFWWQAEREWCQPIEAEKLIANGTVYDTIAAAACVRPTGSIHAAGIVRVGGRHLILHGPARPLGKGSLTITAPSWSDSGFVIVHAPPAPKVRIAAFHLSKRGKLSSWTGELYRALVYSMQKAPYYPYIGNCQMADALIAHKRNPDFRIWALTRVAEDTHPAPQVRVPPRYSDETRRVARALAERGWVETFSPTIAYTLDALHGGYCIKQINGRIIVDLCPCYTDH